MTDTTSPDLAVDPASGLRIGVDAPPWPGCPMDLGSVLDRWVADTPDQLALIDGERVWTYSQLDAAVVEWAQHLRSAGLEPGARLVWSTENRAELVIAFLAAMRLDLIWVGIPPSVGADQRSRLADRAGAAAIVEDDGAVRPTGHVDHLELATDGAHRPAAIAFTSGTTGQPKGVVHSEHSMLAPAAASLVTMPPGDEARHPTPERIATPLSLSILNALLLGPVSALVRGSTAVILRRPWAEAVLDDVRNHRITTLFAVPVLIHDLLELDVDDVAPLRRLVLGGSGAPLAARTEFALRTGVRPLSSYGLTEAPTGVVREDPASPVTAPANRPLPHVAIEIRDDEVIVHPSDFGPLGGRFTGALGYWRDPDATRGLFVGSGLRTGDLGSIDDAGSLQVVGRIGETINRGGASVDPTAIETLLLAQPEIVDAVVVGVPDERLGQRIGAAVVTVSGDLLGLPDRLAASAGRGRAPDVWEVLSELPRNSMGKHDRAAVRQLFHDRTST